MTPKFGRPRRSWRAIVAALTLILTLPATAVGYNTPSAPFVAFAAGVPNGAKLIPLINSGESAFGDTFEGIPDGIGVVPIDDEHIDLYVTHEQSHVPFPIGVVVGGVTQTGTADHQDSSVTRVRVNLETRSIVDMEVVLSPSAGFIRFCSAFMAGPEHGFDNYTFLVNEESNDDLPVPGGAVYGSDPSLAPLREAGYSVYLDTLTQAFDVIPGLGRMNHENTVVVPGGWGDLAALTGDDTFTAPSSQLYLYTADDADAFLADEGTLWGFRVTATHLGAVNPMDPMNNANDYLEIAPGQTWSGEFIEVPGNIARGTDAVLEPQAGLEQWSNDNNIFQFVRVEDIAYDPDNPRIVYFADTGTTRLKEIGDVRLTRVGATDWPYYDSNGRIFKMVLNASDPTVVDSFSILAQGRLQLHAEVLPQTTPRTETITVVDPGVGFVNPDNLAVGKKSIMVQEDPPSNAKVWRYSFNHGTWTHVATATQPIAETSGIVDLSAWMGSGWWAIDVQSHVNQFTDPTIYYWPDGPDANLDPDPYQKRREQGQLLLMFIPSS